MKSAHLLFLLRNLLFEFYISQLYQDISISLYSSEKIKPAILLMSSRKGMTLKRLDGLIIGNLPQRIFLLPIPKQRFNKFPYQYKKSKFLYTDTERIKTLVGSLYYTFYLLESIIQAPRWAKDGTIERLKNHVERSVELSAS